jgi:hypothetical protein
MQNEFVNIEYLRILGMLSGNSNGQFHIALAVQTAEEIGNIVRRSPSCHDGGSKRNQT